MLDATRKWYFSPDDDTLDAYFNFLKKATKKVRIADYSFNLPQFKTILPELVNKGVDVALVLDRSQSLGSTEKPLIASLRASNINMMIGTSSKHQIMHNKWTIIDDEWVQGGSWNYTTRASDQNNFFFIEHNPTLAKVFNSHWEEMYNWIKENEPQSV